MQDLAWEWINFSLSQTGCKILNLNVEKSWRWSDLYWTIGIYMDVHLMGFCSSAYYRKKPGFVVHLVCFSKSWLKSYKIVQPSAISLYEITKWERNHWMMVEITGVCLPRHCNLSLIRKYILITWKYPRKVLMYHHYFNNSTVIDGFLFLCLMLVYQNWVW